MICAALQVQSDNTVRLIDASCTQPAPEGYALVAFQDPAMPTLWDWPADQVGPFCSALACLLATAYVLRRSRGAIN